MIPPRAKLLAAGMMTLSPAFVSLYVADGWLLPVGLGVVLASVASFIVSRPSRIPT